MLAADYSWSRPNLGQLYSAGYRVILRYLGTDTAGRDLSDAELRAIHDTGFLLALIGESAADRAKGGYPAGHADALKYNALADVRRVPSWVPIFYAADFDAANQGAIPTVVDYFRGVLDAGGRPPGAYGQYAVMEALRTLVHNGRQVEHRWQCAAWSGSGVGSGGSIQSGYTRPSPVSAGICLFQHYGLTGPFGATIDRNDVFNGPPDWAWHPSLTPSPMTMGGTIMTKAVTCPDQTGDLGYRVFELDGKRYRESYASRELLDLDLATGLVTGEVVLHGAQGQLFLNRYPEGPPYKGTIIARPAADSVWASEVAGLAPGDRPRFLIYPSGIIVRIRTDRQRGIDQFLGIPDQGELDDTFFLNGTLQPWVADGSDLDAEDVATRVAGKIGPQLEAYAAAGVDAELDKLAD